MDNEGRTDESRVKGSNLHGLGKFARGVHAGVDQHSGIGPVISRQQVGQLAENVIGTEANRDMSGLPECGPAGPRGCLLTLHQDCARVMHQLTPGRGQLELPPATGDQCRAYLRLQGPDLLTERRLRDMQALGGPAEMTLLRQRHNITKAIQLHVKVDRRIQLRFEQNPI